MVVTPGVGTPAPATPAPAAPAPTPGTPALSAVEQATANARAAIAESGSALPKEHHSHSQPRLEGSQQFVKSAIKEVGANVPTGEEPAETPAPVAAPEGGQPAGDPNAAASEGEEPKPGEEPVAGAEGEGEVFSFAIPARNEGEEDIEIPFSGLTQPEIDGLNRLKNGYMRGEEARTIREQAEQQYSQVQDFEEMLAADPAGVFMRGLTEEDGSFDARTAAHAALFLFTRPEIQQAIAPILQKAGIQITNEAAFENLSLRMENERNRLRESYQSEAQERKAWKENARQVMQTITNLLPLEIADDKAALFIRDAKRDIVEYCEKHNMLTLDPKYVPIVLADRMKGAGIDPVQAAARVASGASQQRSNRSSGNGTAANSPANGAGNLPRTPQRTGKEMVEAENRRKSVARVPGPGAGTGSPPPAIPAFDPSKPGSAIEQATAAHRAALAASRGAAKA